MDMNEAFRCACPWDPIKKVAVVMSDCERMATQEDGLCDECRERRHVYWAERLRQEAWDAHPKIVN